MERIKEIQRAKEHFGVLLEKQFERIEEIKKTTELLDFKTLKPIIISIVGGDGIGPYICAQASRILSHILEQEIRDGTVKLKNIEGLTIENRVAHLKAIPDDVLAELKESHVILKGPTTTPRLGDPWPNIESANVAMRKELDLFANVRPVRVPEEGIHWVFFRENTEGSYALGSDGIHVNDDLAVDFTITTEEGSQRIMRAAFEYAVRSGANKVTVVTKANVVKTTDGKFLAAARKISEQYPQVQWDDWYIDIMMAKLIDKKRRTSFKVIVLPNLYGDILTDEAAEFQGGVGTAGSANLGNRYAMFEAIHGSAPRMVEEGRARYADPCSMIQAVKMLLEHIGYESRAEALSKALDICTRYEKKITITGRSTGCTGAELSDYILDTLDGPCLDQKWAAFSNQKPA